LLDRSDWFSSYAPLKPQMAKPLGFLSPLSDVKK
jgi:hypothetical protein